MWVSPSFMYATLVLPRVQESFDIFDHNDRAWKQWCYCDPHWFCSGMQRISSIRRWKGRSRNQQPRSKNRQWLRKFYSVRHDLIIWCTCWVVGYVRGLKFKFTVLVFYCSESLSLASLGWNHSFIQLSNILKISFKIFLSGQSNYLLRSFE